MSVSLGGGDGVPATHGPRHACGGGGGAVRLSRVFGGRAAQPQQASQATLNALRQMLCVARSHLVLGAGFCSQFAVLLLFFPGAGDLLLHRPEAGGVALDIGKGLELLRLTQVELILVASGSA